MFCTSFFQGFNAEFEGCDFEMPKVFAMYKDNTTASISFDQPGTACFNLIMVRCHSNSHGGL